MNAPLDAPGKTPPPALSHVKAWHPGARVVRSALGAHLFVVDGSRLYDIPADLAERLERDLTAGDWAGVDALLADAAPRSEPYIGAEPMEPPALRAISLNVAQTCNMGCGYCYADEGRFGGNARSMTVETAKATIDRLIAEAVPGGHIVVGFMGGEPLMQRKLVHEATHYAVEQAGKAGLALGFSITTNLTLLREEDARLFHDFGFVVQASVDGPREVQNRLRPMKGTGGVDSYGRVRRALEIIERVGRPRSLSARATITPQSGALWPILEHLQELGFDDVGFSAVTESPNPDLAFARAEFDGFLAGMVACGERAVAAILDGRRLPFSNLETALMEIHRGTHRPYPCGAGAGYLSANADGDLYACHRLIDDEAFAMGGTEGSDQEARAALLAAKHVDRQEPCRSCWARYLCGGGCYHEVDRRGRSACDYIRGWLEFCLGAYAEISEKQPGYFEVRPR